MAVAVSPATETQPLTREERRLAWLLRFLGLVFVIGAVGFLLRPDETVADLDRVGALVRLPTLAQTRYPVASDFWLPIAVANLATIATCAFLAAADIRRRRALVHALVVSHLVSGGAGLLLFVRWCTAFPFLATALVDLPIAVILVSALRAAPAVRA